MSGEVKRYSTDKPLAYPPISGETEVYLASDYDALHAEAEALRAENERLNGEASESLSALVNQRDAARTELEAARGLLLEAKRLRNAVNIYPGRTACAWADSRMDERIDAFLTATPATEVRHALSAENQRVVPPEPIIAPQHPLAAMAEQGERQEAVAAQQRFRHPQKTAPDWSPWQPAEVDDKRPAWTIDSQGYEVEYRLLYTSPPPAQGVSGLVEALERAARQMWGSEANMDIEAAEIEQALAAYRNPATVKRCPTCTGTCAEICAKARP